MLDWLNLANGVALASALLASLVLATVFRDWRRVEYRRFLVYCKQWHTGLVDDAPEQLAASSHLSTVWQPVAVSGVALHFATRYVRFNPQTQFLFAARRSRTPRGVLFYSTQVQVRRHVVGASATCPIAWRP